MSGRSAHGPFPLETKSTHTHIIFIKSSTGCCRVGTYEEVHAMDNKNDGLDIGHHSVCVRSMRSMSKRVACLGSLVVTC
jgi:hypothetical protein